MDTTSKGRREEEAIEEVRTAADDDPDVRVDFKEDGPASEGGPRAIRLRELEACELEPAADGV